MMSKDYITREILEDIQVNTVDSFQVPNLYNKRVKKKI